MLARWGIRLATSLAGIAVGILLSAALLDRFSIDATAVVVASVLFWIVHIVVQFLALRVLIRQPSVAFAGLLALASTIVALVIVNVIVDGMSISGASTYAVATLIIWLTTVVGDIVGGRMIRTRRAERQE
jgi:putative membrane protein